MTRTLKSTAGFTLVELMIASTLGTVVIGAVLSSYIFVGRSLARLSSYQALEQESRKALAYISRDLMQAQSVKTGTTPTETAVTLVLPSGEVSYTFDATAKSLRRVATFGVSPDVTFLRNTSCEASSFRFRYYTADNGAPTDQATNANVPYSIKQIQVSYTLESPSTWTAETRTRFEIASSRYVVRNRGASDGT